MITASFVFLLLGWFIFFARPDLRRAVYASYALAIIFAIWSMK